MKKALLKIVLFFLIINSFSSCSNEDYEYIQNVNSSLTSRIADTDLQSNTFFELIPGTLKSITTIKSFDLTNGNNIDNIVNYAVKSYTVVYYTTDNSGNQVKASGTLLIPQKNNASEVFPLLSFQHGTMYGDLEVLNAGQGNQAFLFASTGFVTMVPDYLGYNKSNQIQHPYFINSCSNKNVRDMITASLYALNLLGVNHNNRLLLNGFSEGANVTISFLKNFQENPITGLNLVATSVGSGAYALGDQFSYMMYYYFNYSPNVSPATNSILYYMVYGYEKNIAQTNNLGLYFANPFNTNLPIYFSGDYNATTASNTLELYRSIYYQIFSTSFINSLNNGSNIGFKNYLDQNSLIISFPLKSKLKLYHALDDILVPSQNTTKLYNKLRENVSNIPFVQSITTLTGGHSPDVHFKEAIFWLYSNR